MFFAELKNKIETLLFSKKKKKKKCRHTVFPISVCKALRVSNNSAQALLIHRDLFVACNFWVQLWSHTNNPS